MPLTPEEAKELAALEQELEPQAGLTPEEEKELAALEAEFAPAKEEIGPIEAGLKGAAQDLTFGFSDEIIAAAKSAFGPETYEQELAKAQEELKGLEGRDAYEVGKWLGFAGSMAIPGAALAKVPALAKVGKAAAEVGKKAAKTTGKAAMAAGTAYGVVAHPQITIPLLAARYGKRAAEVMKKFIAKEGDDVIKGAAEILKKGGKEADNLVDLVSKGKTAAAKKSIIDPFAKTVKKLPIKSEPKHILEARQRHKKKEDLAKVLQAVKPEPESLTKVLKEGK